MEDHRAWRRIRHIGSHGVRTPSESSSHCVPTPGGAAGRADDGRMDLLTILVVEDDQSLCDYVSVALGGEGVACFKHTEASLP